MIKEDEPSRRRLLLRSLTWHGAHLAEPTPAYRESWKMADTQVGLHVASVQPNSSFATQGLKRNTFIVRYNGNPIRTLEDFLSIDDQVNTYIVLEFDDGKSLTLNRTGR